MKMIGLREFRDSVGDCVKASQRDRVLIMRHGKPAALLVGVEGEDLEDLLTAANPAFWKMIEESRKPGRRTYSLDEVEKELRVVEAAEQRRAKRRRRRKAA